MYLSKKATTQEARLQEALLVTLSVCAAAVVFLWAPDVMASGGSGMPWESTLNKFLQSLQGPVARTAGVAAVVITGIAFAFGEGGQWFKKGLGILFGLSIAFSATSFINQLGFSGGALI